jgi:hypothetical protein
MYPGAASDAGNDLAAGDQGQQQLAPVRTGCLGDRDRRGRDDHADVADRVGVGIVEVEPVAQHPVRQRGRGGRRAGRHADDRGRAGGSARHRDGAPGRRDPAGVGGQPRAERVEQMQPRGREGLGGNVVIREVADPLGDLAGHRHRGPRVAASTSA